MRRLLWKEWQERGWWLLLWLLGMVVISALGLGFTPISVSATSVWATLMPLLAVLSGLAGFGSELKGERALFLFSRAVSWKQVLAAKVLFGVIAALVISIISTAASALCCPEIYRSFITPASLGGELLVLAAITGIPYLIGLACSIVLPGLAGSVLVLLAGFGLFAGAIYVNSELHQQSTVFLQWALLLVPVTLTVVIARFGLTLSLRERITRAAVIMVGLVAVPLLLDISPLGNALQKRRFPNHPYSAVSVSPSGQYQYLQIGHYNIGGTPGKNRYDHRWVAGGRRFDLPYPQDDDCYWRRWLDGDLLVVRTNMGKVRPGTLSVTRWAESGPQTVSLRDLTQSYLRDETPMLVSPDRRRLLIVRGAYFQLFDLAANTAVIYNTHAGALVDDPDNTPAPVLPDLQAWWDSDTVIGYQKPERGERHSLDVRMLPVPAGTEGNL
ncbi:MAG: ABC transporter permease [Armatimonadota bacterium]